MGGKIPRAGYLHPPPTVLDMQSCMLLRQGSYASGEMPGNFKIFQGQGISYCVGGGGGGWGWGGGEMKFCQNVREFYISVLK